MENAAKALIIAGGILLALLLISGLVMMTNEIGIFQKSQYSNTQTTKIAQFNSDFERYTDDKGIQGTDIISLINKIESYNKKADERTDTNYIDYNIKMSIEVTNLKAFNTKYANNSKAMFKSNTYIFSNTSGSEIKDIFDKLSDTESGIGIDNMKKIVAYYDSSKSKTENVNDIKEQLLKINSKYANWNGTTDPTLETISKYKQYSEFKSSKFISSQSPEYEKGQIKKLYFKFNE